MNKPVTMKLALLPILILISTMTLPLGAQILNFKDISNDQATGFDSILTNDLSRHLHNIGDYDNDGIDDIVFSSEGKSNSDIQNGGYWLATLNASGTIKQSYFLNKQIKRYLTDTIQPFDDYFAYGIDAISDLDNNGYRELVVGLSDFTLNYEKIPSIAILFMDSLFEIKNIKRIPWTEFDEIEDNFSFGYNVVNIGDINKDGYDDIAVTQPRVFIPNTSVSHAGFCHIIRLGANGSIVGKNTLWNVKDRSISSFWGFGSGLYAQSDFDNDGINEIVVGSPHTDATLHGSVTIFFIDSLGKERRSVQLNGNTLPWPSDYLADEDAHFGEAITSPGDITGDGIPELIISAHWNTVDIEHSGMLFIFEMTEQGDVKNYAQIFDPELEDIFLIEHSHLGNSMTMLWDIDNNGYNEILVNVDDVENEYYGKLRILSTDYKYFFDILSSVEHMPKSETMIYPNPVQHTLNLKSNTRFDRYEIYNRAGQKCLSYVLDSEQIDVTSLENGHYILVLISETENKNIAFVKQ